MARVSALTAVLTAVDVSFATSVSYISGDPPLLASLLLLAFLLLLAYMILPTFLLMTTSLMLQLFCCAGDPAVPVVLALAGVLKNLNF